MKERDKKVFICRKYHSFYRDSTCKLLELIENSASLWIQDQDQISLTFLYAINYQLEYVIDLKLIHNNNEDYKVLRINLQHFEDILGNFKNIIVGNKRPN